MSRSIRLAVTVVALLGVAPLLSACHTTAGLGKDMSQGGHALTNSANANTPKQPNP
jgi:predicted small secreted protein